MFSYGATCVTKQWEYGISRKLDFFLETMITIIKLIAGLNNDTMGKHVIKCNDKYRGMERN